METRRRKLKRSGPGGAFSVKMDLYHGILCRPNSCRTLTKRQLDESNALLAVPTGMLCMAELGRKTS